MLLVGDPSAAFTVVFGLLKRDDKEIGLFVLLLPLLKTSKLLSLVVVLRKEEDKEEERTTRVTDEDEDTRLAPKGVVATVVMMRVSRPFVCEERKEKKEGKVSCSFFLTFRVSIFVNFNNTQKKFSLLFFRKKKIIVKIIIIMARRDDDAEHTKRCTNSVESSSSEDDSEDDEKSQTYLGFSGRMVSSKDVYELDAFATKVGGEPNFKFANDDDDASERANNVFFREEQMRCKSCESKLSLIFQAYAPLTRTRDGTEEDILERTLYVFSCTNFQNCCPPPKSESTMGGKWRAFRVQKRGRKGNETTSENRRDVNNAKKEECLNENENLFGTNDDWGCAESKDDWNGEAKNGAKKEEEESLEQLTKQLDEAMLKEKERKEAVELLEEEEGGDETLIESYHEDAPNALPEFYVCSDLEPTKAEAKRKALGLSAKVDSMLNKYAQEEGLEVSEIEKSLLALHAGGKAVEMKDMMNESGTKEVSSSWQGETYEKGESINASEQYLKFQKRIARAPAQIARYCFRTRDCDIAWPDGNLPTRKSKPCEKCKGKREMELQLTPGLLKEIEDALRLRAKAGRKGGISESDAIAFDFNSVGIWTCTNSCFDGSETTCVREEEVFVATDGIDQSVLAKLAAAI